MGSLVELRRRSSRQREEAERLGRVARQQRLESIGLVRRARHFTFDRHGPVLAMWRDDEGAGSVPEDLAVRQLFSITIDLASAISLNGDKRLDGKLRDLIVKTDGMISELQRAAAVADATDPAPSFDNVPDGLAERRRAIGLLRQAGFTVDWLLSVGRNGSDTGDVDLEEASQAIHRALIALSSPGSTPS